MINIAICDDNTIELERAGSLLKQYAYEHPQYQINTVFFSAPFELIAYAETNKSLNVLLLDVYMPGILGTEAARELRDMGDSSEIIFLTTSRDHAIDAFSLSALHYLLKPYTEKEFFSALDRALANLSKKDGIYITVKSTEGITRVNLNTLVYSETDNHLQHLHLSDGRTIGVRKSSAELFELIEEDPRFYKGGSTYIINMDYVCELSSKHVNFSTGAQIPMLSRKYSEFKEKYMDYSCSR